VNTEFVLSEGFLALETSLLLTLKSMATMCRCGLSEGPAKSHPRSPLGVLG